MQLTTVATPTQQNVCGMKGHQYEQSGFLISITNTTEKETI